jgi:hypothetical protein
MFALTFVLSPLPMPIGLILWILLIGITVNPDEISEARLSGEMPSEMATSFISSVIIPFFASSILVILLTSEIPLLFP